MLTVFAGHCRGGAVPGSTQLWVEALRQVSSQVVLVFDNAVIHWPEAWQGAAELALLCEAHGEYDFGSYKRGLVEAQRRGWLAAAPQVLLCNDSVVGPLAPLEPLLERMCANQDEAWGLIHSLQRTPHLQSWFLVLGRQVIAHPLVQAFFEGVSRQPHRQAVIETYELGFSRALLAAGFPLQGWIKAEQWRHPGHGQRVGNPCMFPTGMVQLGIPLIKRRALREPAANADGIEATCRLIAERQPPLWQCLLQDTEHWRLWRDAVAIALLLAPEAWSELETRLDWLMQQPHPRWRLVLPISAAEPQRMGELLHRFRAAVEQAHLQLVPVPEQVSLSEQWNLCIAACSDRWIGLPSPGFWGDRLNLQRQASQIARQPERDHWPGPTKLMQREWLLRRGGLQATDTP